MYFTYQENLSIPDGAGGAKQVPSTKGFNMSDILDFGSIVTDDIKELMVRLNAKETKMVPERVIENKKDVIKNVKREILVTHIITNADDIQKFLDAIKVFS